MGEDQSFGKKSVGDEVNVEADVMAKYSGEMVNGK